MMKNTGAILSKEIHHVNELRIISLLCKKLNLLHHYFEVLLVINHSLTIDAVHYTELPLISFQMLTNCSITNLFPVNQP